MKKLRSSRLQPVSSLLAQCQSEERESAAELHEAEDARCWHIPNTPLLAHAIYLQWDACLTCNNDKVRLSLHHAKCHSACCRLRTNPSLGHGRCTAREVSSGTWSA